MAYGRLILAAAGLLFAAMAHADGANALQAFYHKVHDLSAHFHQTRRDDTGHVIQEASGNFLLSRPEKFRWQYNKPYRQVIVSNGRKFKFYDVDLAQVTVRNVNAALKATPAVLLTGGKGLKDAFKVSSDGTRDGIQWVTLIPRNDNAQFKKIRLGLRQQVPARMILEDKLGQTTHIRFSNVKVNPKIADKRFKLQLPKGVEVVDGRPKNRSYQGASRFGQMSGAAGREMNAASQKRTEH